MTPARTPKKPSPRRRTRKAEEPDASASPVETTPVVPTARSKRIAKAEVTPEVAPRRRRIVRPAPEATEPVVEATVALVKQEPAPIVFLEAPIPVGKPELVEAPAPVPEAAPAPARKRGRPSKVDEYQDRIGVMPDEELAALAGVALSTVKAWRKVRSLAAVPTRAKAAGEGKPVEVPVPVKPRKATKVGKDRKPRKTRMDDYLDRIGVLPDAEVAMLAGVTVANVSAYRRRRGIPAPGRWGRVAVEPVAVEPVAIEIPIAEPVPEALAEMPAAPAPVGAAPAPVGAKGYLVVASDDSEFIVLADDFAGAAVLAVQRLAKWKPGVQVVALEYAADFLPE